MKGLSDHLCKEGSTQPIEFSNCRRGAVFLLLLGEGCWFAFLVFFLFTFLTAQSSTISTPALGKALLWLDPACSCWLKPQKNVSVQARIQTCIWIRYALSFLILVIPWYLFWRGRRIQAWQLSQVCLIFKLHTDSCCLKVMISNYPVL